MNVLSSYGRLQIFGGIYFSVSLQGNLYFLLKSSNTFCTLLWYVVGVLWYDIFLRKPGSELQRERERECSMLGTVLIFVALSPQIQWFWRALRSFDQADRARFLQFVTGTSKVPLQGFAALEGMNGVQKFQIHRDDRSTDRLPCAHTWWGLGVASSQSVYSLQVQSSHSLHVTLNHDLLCGVLSAHKWRTWSICW